MLRDLVSVSAHMAVAVSHITLSNWSPSNDILLQSQQYIKPPPNSPSVNVFDVKQLAENNMVMGQYIFNQTSKTISAVFRSGMRQIIKPIDSDYSGNLILRNVYIIHQHNTPALDKFYYNSLKDTHQDNQELKLITDQYIEFRQTSRPDHMCIIIDAIIPESVIEEHVSIYVHNRDLVISLEDADIAPAHPFDALENSKERNEQLLQNQSGVGVIVELIDNINTTSDRFFHLGKQIYSIRPVKDNTRKDGVYVFKTYTDCQHQRHTTSTHYTLEEAEKEIGLYASYELAVAGGDIKSLREEELELRKHDNNLLKVELDKSKSLNEQLMLKLKLQQTEQEVKFKERINQLDRDLKESEHLRKKDQEKWDLEKLDMQRRLEHDRDRYAYRDMERKDYYDHRSHYRKDVSEGIKMWPVVLTAAVGVFAYLTKNK